MMIARTAELSREARAELRGRAGAAQVEIESLYADRDWTVAASEYVKAQRRAGQEEMARLMGAAGFAAPVQPEEQKALIALAAQVYLGARARDVKVLSLGKDAFRLEVRDCPIYRRLERQYRGNTACTCFARRRGWYDAMGGGLWDQLETNLKWGDPFCSVTVFRE